MKVGSTGIILIGLEVGTSLINTVRFTAKGAGGNKVTKTYPGDATYSSGTFSIPLTQEDTLEIGAGICTIEGQINYKDLSVAKTTMTICKMAPTLATEVIDGNSPSGIGDEELEIEIEGDVIIATVPIDDTETSTGKVWSSSKTAAEIKVVESKIPSLEGYAKTADVESTYAKKSEIPTVPTKTSDLTNDSGFTTLAEVATVGYQTEAEVKATVEGYGYQTEEEVESAIGTATADKQDKLIAGENISIAEDGKTISATGGSTYDDTEVRNLISTETARATSAEGENTKQINRLWKVAKNQLYDLESQTESGTNVIPTGAYWQSLVEADGKTEQVTYNGYQLFDKDNPNYNAFYDYNNVVNALSGAFSLTIPITGGKTYTASRTSILETNFRMFTTEEYPSTNATVIETASGNKASSITLTTSSSANYLTLYYHWPDQSIYTREEFAETFMIEEGSTAHSYEPYVGGIPSPNPDYPQSISGITELNVTVDGATTTITPPFTMYKVGNYADKLICESVETEESEGKKWVWKWRKNIGTHSFTTAEFSSFKKNTSYAYPLYQGVYADVNKLLDGNVKVRTTNILSNKLIYSTAWSTTQYTMFCGGASIIFGFSEPTDFDFFYELETAVDTTITDTTLLTFLNSLVGADTSTITITDQDGEDVSYIMEYVVKLSDTVSTTEGSDE